MAFASLFPQQTRSRFCKTNANLALCPVFHTIFPLIFISTSRKNRQQLDLKRLNTATIFRTTSGGGAGTPVTLAANDDFILADGIQIYSDNDPITAGSGGNNLFLSSNSSVIGFSSFSFDPAISLDSDGTSSNLFVSETASVWSNGFAVRALNDFNQVKNTGTIEGVSAGIDVQGSFECDPEHRGGS